MIKSGTNILKEHKKKTLEFNPKIKQINFLDNRVYERKENLYYPSVTSILQYMPKNRFFEQWLKETGPYADFIMQRAAREGTQVHNAIEKLVEGETIEWMDSYGQALYDQKVWEMILKFVDFWNTYKPTLLKVEEFVYSDKYHYAGAVDLVVEVDKEVYMIDIKTSNHIHKSYDLQLAAYKQAWEELGYEKIDKTGVLWLKSKKRGPSRKKEVIQGAGWELACTDDPKKDFQLFQNIYTLYKLENPETKPIYKSYPTVINLNISDEAI